MSRNYNDELQFLDKINKNCWRIKKGFVPNMQVEGVFYVNDALEKLMFEELRNACRGGGVGGFLPAMKQIGNVAALPGIVHLGTLGAGNHYAEIQVVDEIFNEYAAKKMGIDHKGQVCVMIHSGSRGLGHQVATDALVAMEKAMKRDKIIVNDRQLACARIASPEGQDYLKGMAAAGNYAWVNRSSMTFLTRQLTGQPVLIGGTMGTCSYVLTGTEQGMTETFGTTCHGAGRALSRAKSRRNLDFQDVLDKLADMGIAIRVASPKLVMEEAPDRDINTPTHKISKSKI